MLGEGMLCKGGRKRPDYRVSRCPFQPFRVLEAWTATLDKNLSRYAVCACSGVLISWFILTKHNRQRQSYVYLQEASAGSCIQRPKLISVGGENLTTRQPNVVRLSYCYGSTTVPLLVNIIYVGTAPHMKRQEEVGEETFRVLWHSPSFHQNIFFWSNLVCRRRQI